MNKDQLKELSGTLIEQVHQASEDFSRKSLCYEGLRELFYHSLEEGVGPQGLINFFKNYLDYSVNTAHPLFDNQLFGGVEYSAVLGDMLTALTNTTMATFESSPVGTVLEKLLNEKLNGIIGYSEGDGIMVSGGSQANNQAMLCARQRWAPEHRSAPETMAPLRIFVSEHAHYSFKKAALIMGMGDHGVVKVPVNKHNQMDPEALEKAIVSCLEKGEKPIMVGATMGTTVYGAFDDLCALSPICDKYNLWLHADGAWGAPAFFTPRFAPLLKGSELADSWTWDAHKLMGASLTNTFFLTRHKSALFETNSVGDGRYIFHGDPVESLDIGPKSVQCGRRTTATSLWVQWLIEGDRGFTEKIEKLENLKQLFVKKLKALPQVEIISDPVFFNLCFRFLPKNPATDANVYNKKIRETLIEKGLGMVNYHEDGDGLLFFRYIFVNFQLNEETVHQLVENMVSVANSVGS